MAINLPRSPKWLHFTGNVKAFGRPLTPASPQASPAAEVPTKRPPARLPIPKEHCDIQVAIRDPQPSVGDDDIETEAIDREALDAVLFPTARRDAASRAAKLSRLPVPHFRSSQEANRHLAKPVVAARRRPKRRAFPLGAWLLAALVAGVLSFHFAPEARAGVEQAMRTLDAVR